MKIVDKKRFIKSVSVTVSLIIFIILMLINTSFSHTETTYKTISVISGDSLWSIAKYEKYNNTYFLNKDIRYIIDEIRYINNLETSNLSIGDELVIPIV